MCVSVLVVCITIILVRFKMVKKHENMESTVNLLPNASYASYSLNQFFFFFFCPSGQNFEVATNTKIKDLVQSVSKKLMLASADGFSLFVKTPDKVCTQATVMCN